MKPFSICMFSPVREARLDMDQCGNSGYTRVFRLDGTDDLVGFVPDDHGTSLAGFASLHRTIWNTEFIHVNIQNKHSKEKKNKTKQTFNINVPGLSNQTKKTATKKLDALTGLHSPEDQVGQGSVLQ